MNEETLALAKSVALNMHYGQKYGKKDYSYHLESVADSVGDNSTLKTIAWLHDILEDTETTIRNLKKTFPLEIVDAVIAMTKIEGESYDDYIDRVKSNHMARVVKIHDTLCNLNESVKDQDWNRVRKYSKQMSKMVEIS